MWSTVLLLRERARMRALLQHGLWVWRMLTMSCYHAVTPEPRAAASHERGRRVRGPGGHERVPRVRADFLTKFWRGPSVRTFVTA